MRIHLQRVLSTDEVTLGELQVDGVFECFTLEDAIRETKVFGRTCIPAGTYDVIVNHSPRFNKLLPRLVDVPGFTGVLIHAGNGPEDTKGCVLVGAQLDGQRIKAGTSRPAFASLFEKILEAWGRDEQISIDISNPEVVHAAE